MNVIQTCGINYLIDVNERNKNEHFDKRIGLKGKITHHHTSYATVHWKLQHLILADGLRIRVQDGRNVDRCSALGII